MFLRVRPATILHWVELGLLKARVTTRSDGKPIHKFDHEEVVKFCRDHMPVLLPRKWPQKRLEFIELIACTPKHADQLATREAKKEHEAYEEQMSRDEESTETKNDTLANGQVTSGAARGVSTRAVANTRRGGRSQNNGLEIDDCARPTKV